jgi:hypothetical protein
MTELHEFDLIDVLIEIELELVLEENVIEGLIFRFTRDEEGVSINK